MYLKHFGLERPPFRITPDPHLFYRGGKRGAVLDALIYAITSGEGIIKVVGEVGSGKTMLCRMLATQLPAHVEIVYIANPNLPPENILPAIAFELSLRTADDRLQAMQTLQKWLLEQHTNGRQVVVFIEEAQSMPLATLEEIRLLSNLETDRCKLLQIVLFGQPELDVKLGQSEIRQLRERISHSFQLMPLHLSDVETYLNFRMRAAGYRGREIFDRRRARLVRGYSRGRVRRVNIISDKALLAAFADGDNRVRSSHVRIAASDSAYAPPLRWRVGNAFIASLLCGLIAITFTTTSSRSWSQLAILLESASSRAPSLSRDEKTSRTASPGARSTLPIASDAQDADHYTVQTWLLDTDVWLRHAPYTDVSIQLLSVTQSNSSRLQAYLLGLGELIELDQIHIYKTVSDGHRMLSVLYRQFATRREALAVIRTLPDELRRNRPFVRTVAELRRETKG